MIDLNETISHGVTALLGAASGLIGGVMAEKKAAKSEAVQELQMLKSEYKEFADYTREELERSREDRKECLKENDAMKCEILAMKAKVNELSTAMHHIIGTPKDKRKPLNPNN